MNNLVKIVLASTIIGTSMITGAYATEQLKEVNFKFQSFTDNVNVIGQFGVKPDGEIVKINGTVNNTVFGKQVISGLVSNSNFPGISYSPDGLFYYNNLLTTSTNPQMDLGGVSGYWNLWGTGPNTYELYASSNGGYPVQEMGSLTTGVPELSSWMMMLIGFTTLGFVGYKKKISVTATA